MAITQKMNSNDPARMWYDIPFTDVNGADNRGDVVPAFSDGKLPHASPEGMTPPVSWIIRVIALSSFPHLGQIPPGQVAVLDLEFSNLKAEWATESYPFALLAGSNDYSGGNTHLISIGAMTMQQSIYGVYARPEQESDSQPLPFRASMTFWPDGRREWFVNGSKLALPEVQHAPIDGDKAFLHISRDASIAVTMRRLRVWTGPDKIYLRGVLPSLLGGGEEYLTDTVDDDLKLPEEEEEDADELLASNGFLGTQGAVVAGPRSTAATDALRTKVDAVVRDVAWATAAAVVAGAIASAFMVLRK